LNCVAICTTQQAHRCSGELQVPSVAGGPLVHVLRLRGAAWPRGRAVRWRRPAAARARPRGLVGLNPSHSRAFSNEIADRTLLLVHLVHASAFFGFSARLADFLPRKNSGASTQKHQCRDHENTSACTQKTPMPTLKNPNAATTKTPMPAPKNPNAAITKTPMPARENPIAWTPDVAAAQCLHT